MRLYLINPSNPLVSSRQRQREPLEPLPRVETAQPDGAGGPDAAGMGNHDRGREPRRAGLPAMPRPDLVGITAFTSQANRAYEVAAHFRRLGVPVVMGGIHATMCLDEVMEHVDSVVTGEAESIWPQVLEDARHGSLKRQYDGGLADISRFCARPS